MTYDDRIAATVWPEEALGAAAAALLHAQGWTRDPRAPVPAVPAGADARDRWLAAWGRAHDVEIDPVDAGYGDVGQFFKGAGPALVRLPAPHAGVLALLSCSGRSLWCLAADGMPQRLPLARIEQLFLDETDGRTAAATDSLLEGAALDPARRAAVRRTLLNERFADRRLALGWLVRLSPAAPLRLQIGEARVPILASAVAVAQLAAQLLIVASWLTVGDLLVAGRLQWGAAHAWSLLLLTAIPFHAFALWGESVVALKLGALFKRRLLHGLLRFDSDDSRRAGAGRMVGLAMEADMLELTSAAGGLLAFLAALRLTMALLLLAAVAGGPSLTIAAALLAWMALGFLGARSLWRRTHEWAQAYRALANDLVEKMAGHRTYVAQLHRDEWHHDEDTRLLDYWRKSVPLDRRLAAIAGGLARGWLVIGAALLTVVSWRTGADLASLGLLLLAVLLAYQAFTTLASAAPALIQFVISSREIAPLVAAGARRGSGAEEASLPDDEPGGDASAPAAAQADGPPARVIDASALTFRFSERTRLVLNGVDLRIHEGDRLLLEGPSGGGKSTLAAVLSGARAPTAGRVRLGDRGIGEVGADRWRKRVLRVPQFHENHVFTGTFAFNLLLGRRWPPGAGDLAEAAAICHELGLGPLLERMPDGMSQMVGESGWILSHGERSRLFIARALLQDADLVILDESFAALDPETAERAIACVLRRARTVMVIAHP